MLSRDIYVQYAQRGTIKAGETSTQITVRFVAVPIKNNKERP